MNSPLLQAIWKALTGNSYYTGEQASRQRGLPPSVTSGVAYADLPEHLRHQLWLRAKATDSAGRAAMAAELADAGSIRRRSSLAAHGETSDPADPVVTAQRERGGDRLLHR